jgi:cell division protein FtsL
MAAPPAFSTYVALSQERQARSVELRKAALIVIIVVAVALVALLYLYLHTNVVVRSEQVRLMDNQRQELLKRNQELAYRIAWETAPQRVEDRASKLRLAPISKWQLVQVPGLSNKLKGMSPITTPGTSLPYDVPAPEPEAKLSLEIVFAQIKSWLGLGLRSPSATQPTP